MLLRFDSTVSALTYSIVEERCQARLDAPGFPHNRVVDYVRAQHAGLPDYLCLPLRILTVVMDGWTILRKGRPFHALDHADRWEIIQVWKTSRISFRRDLVRFYESLAIFGWYAEID